MKLSWQSLLVSGFVLVLLMGACAKSTSTSSQTPTPTTVPVAQNLPEPPSFEPYVDKGACPFECCGYKTWLTTKPVMLLDTVNGNKIVATIKAGENVSAITGDVYTIPTVIEFTDDYTNKTLAAEPIHYFKNTQAKVLTYEGEGYYKVYYQGKFYDDGVAICIISSPEACDEPIPAKVLLKGKSEWWVNIKLKNGVSGWTKVEDDNFTNNDNCG